MKFLLLFLSLLIFNANIVQASDALDMSSFARLPILHEGRVKPLDSFARIELFKFSKKENPSGLSPLTWLANSVFNPADAVDDKIFLIENSEARHLLGLEDRKKPLYSYVELVPGLEKTTALVSQWMKDPMKKQPEERVALLAVHENALEYTHLLRSLSLALPLNIQLTPSLEKELEIKKDTPITYLLLQKLQPEIEENIRKIVRHKGEDPSRYNKQEQEVVTLGWQLKTIAEAGQGNELFRVIPSTDEEGFVSLWSLVNSGKGGVGSEQAIEVWQSLAKAWQGQKPDVWNATLSKLQDSKDAKSRSTKLWIEVIYNQVSPFWLSILFYAASVVFVLLYAINKKAILNRLAIFTICCALLLQAMGLATRILLMERPPVGTLYESILFVGFVAPLFAFLSEYRLRNGIGIFCGALAGVLLGVLGYSMAGEGDTMKVLGAVLNTRFWLTTHVLCITIGYSWCLLTSVLSHLVLLDEFVKKSNFESRQSMMRMLKTHALFSLLFTTVGTILGGIWADQSWGRFWGWDPKENGALLIVLWLVWIIHGKISGQIAERVWVAGLAMLSVVVAAAWLGVNLLGVGLHSYGFIEGVFWGLGVFALFEILMIGGLLSLLHKGDKVNAGASSHAA